MPALTLKFKNRVWKISYPASFQPFVYFLSSLFFLLSILISILISEDSQHSSCLYQFIGANNINRKIKN